MILPAGARFQRVTDPGGWRRLSDAMRRTLVQLPESALCLLNPPPRLLLVRHLDFMKGMSFFALFLPHKKPWTIAVALSAVELLSPDGLEALIGHELGHAVVFACGGNWESEDAANAQAEEWGFAVAELRGGY
jgi:hypothetical protein